jgi:hypothetical protein
MPRKTRKANFEPYESKAENSNYLRITHNMLNSEAWQALDPYDITAYLYFKSKYTRKKNGDYNHSDISLTYKEMEEFMSWGRFSKSIDNLIRVGLIDMVRHSPHTRDATIYGLSSRWHNYKTPEFKEQKRVKLARPRCKK